MLVKKKKTTTKKKTVQKKQIETDIEEAVKKIPEFLFGKMETPLPPSALPVKNQPINYRRYRTRRMLMWLGVGALAAAIFGVWVWNVASFWQDAGEKTSAENGLWQKAKSGISALNKPFPNELQTALKQNETKAVIKQQLEMELTKAKVKDALEQKIIYEKQTANTK